MQLFNWGAPKSHLDWCRRQREKIPYMECFIWLKLNEGAIRNFIIHVLSTRCSEVTTFYVINSFLTKKKYKMNFNKRSTMVKPYFGFIFKYFLKYKIEVQLDLSAWYERKSILVWFHFIDLNILFQMLRNTW